MSAGGVPVDVVVLGLGAGGEYAARKLAEAGLDVVGVERALVGGECPFWGCTPSKLLIHTAHQGQPWSRAAGRIREANHDWTDDSHAGPLMGAGVRVVRGHGRLDGPGRVVVTTDRGSERLEARLGVLLNTGTEPAVPDIAGLVGTPYWTNRDVMRRTEPPASLVIIGAGPIGTELAQAFGRFGTRVTLLEARDRMLCPEEPEACEVISGVLRDEGIEIRTGVEVTEVRHDESGFTVDVEGAPVRAERLLVATGRRMNLTDVGLDTAGLDPGCDRVETDERMRAADRLWAVGDITGHGAYTHLSIYQAQVAVRDLLGEPGPGADYRAVSRVTFTDPEIGSVGLSEEQARDAGLRVTTGHAEVPRSSRGWIHEAEGIVKVVADADRGVLVGGTVVAPYGGEVLGLLAAAVHAEIPVPTLRGMHFAYPTFHRAIAAALADLG